jgi:DNA-binding CsgD family transcriptional regulator
MLKMNTIRFNNEKEIFVLALWACSQTVKESARYLKMSVRSVNYYRGRLRCKLGANTSTEVIRKIVLSDEYEALIRLGKNLLMSACPTGALQKWSLCLG